MNDSVMISSEKNSAGPTSTRRVANQTPVRSPCQVFLGMFVVPALDMLVCVLDHHDRRIDHCTDGNRNAAKRHDVGVDALLVHHDEGDKNAERQRDDRDQCGTQMQQEHDAHQCDDDELFDQLLGEIAAPRAR